MAANQVLHKDAPAGETIERVRGILERAGFPRSAERVSWFRAFRDCHSCRLTFTNYPVLGANGKGLTPKLAHASGLAEFVERLQGYAEALFDRAGDIVALRPVVAARPRSIAEIEADAPGLIALAGGAWPRPTGCSTAGRSSSCRRAGPWNCPTTCSSP